MRIENAEEERFRNKNKKKNRRNDPDPFAFTHPELRATELVHSDRLIFHNDTFKDLPAIKFPM